MVISILLGILFMGGIVGIAVMFVFNAIKAKRRPDLPKKNTLKRTIVSLAIAAGLLVAFIFVPFGFVQINAGEAGVVTRFGEPTAVLNSGLHFRNVFTQSVERYDLTVQRLDLEIEAHTQDAQPFTATATIYVAVEGDQLLYVIRRFGTLETLLNNFRPAAIDGVKAALVDKEAMELIQQRAALPAMINTMVSPIGEEFFLDIRQAALPELQFSRAFIDEIEAQMIAQQEIRRVQYEQERQVIEAETRRLMAEVEKQIIVIQAQADADAMEVMMRIWNGQVWQPYPNQANPPQNAVNEDGVYMHWADVFGDVAEMREMMLRQMIIETWDGRLPETVIGSEIFDILLNMFGNGSATP